VRPYSWKVDKVKKPDTRSLEKATAQAILQTNPSPDFRMYRKRLKTDTKATAVRFLLPGEPEPPRTDIPDIILSLSSGLQEQPRWQPSTQNSLDERRDRCLFRIKIRSLEKRLGINDPSRKRRDSLEGLPQIQCSRTVKPERRWSV